MAPKKQVNKPSKTEVAKKAKVADDKTFGLKNKNKSAKVQQYVQQVQNQSKNATQPKADAAAAKKSKKEAEEAAQRELNDLFAQAIKQPKVPPGTDPKSVVCEYYRQGRCTKGHKCKYSHDLNVERKGGKIDLFTERREDQEGMEDWDQDKLEEVVNQKHGTEKPTNKTDIICKFFLDAVESKLYGWFWSCPNGKECKYRHALPPGYVLKSQMKELIAEEAANRKDIEDVIEEERAKVDAKTPITQDVFLGWRQKNRDDKKRAREDTETERKRKGVMTGREIFAQEGFTIEDDFGATDDFTRENDVEEEFQRARRQAEEENARKRAEDGPSYPEADAGPTIASNGQQDGEAGQTTGLKLSKEEEALFDDDDPSDDELDDDDERLDELEAKLTGSRV